MCEMHEEIYKDIDPKIIKIIEANQVELHALIDKIGSQIAPFVFSGIMKLNEAGEPEKLKAEDIPDAMTRMMNTSGLLYVISWLAAESSPSEAYDELLTNIYVNGVNDGNAYLCVNKTKAH